MIKKYILLMAILLMVTVLMLFPFPFVPDKYNIDKVAHLLAFSSLAFLSFYSINISHKKQIKTNVVVFLLLFAFSTSTEYLQIFIPHRGFSYYDLLSNWMGVTAGVVIFLFYKKFRNKKVNK